MARPRSPARTPSSSPSRARSRGGRACRAGRRRPAASMSSMLWPGQLAVRRPRPHVEVDVAGAVLRGVGVAARDQLADQLEHLRDVAGGGRLVGRRQHVERVVRPVELALHRVGEVVPGPALLGGLGQDLVVDVGDVADEGRRRSRWRAATAAARRSSPPSARDRRAAPTAPSGRTRRCPPCPARGGRSRGPRASRCRGAGESPPILGARGAPTRIADGSCDRRQPTCDSSVATRASSPS